MQASNVTGVIDWLNKKCKSCELDTPDASGSYKELGKESQNIAGIPVHKQVLIKKIPQNHPWNNSILGAADYQFIYVNEDKLDKQLYGTKRLVLLHEAIHAKNHDAMHSALNDLQVVATVAASPFIYICASSVTSKIPLATNKTIMQKTAYRMMQVKIPAIIFINFFAFYNLMTGNYYQEQRADKEAAYLSQCYQCVHDFANHRPSETDYRKDNQAILAQGYLSRESLALIAYEFKNRNLLCAYHEEMTQKQLSGWFSSISNWFATKKN